MRDAGMVLLYEIPGPERVAEAIGRKHEIRVTVPFHGAAILHPNIVKQTLEIIDEAAKPRASRG
jgi:hypothetical protein